MSLSLLRYWRNSIRVRPHDRAAVVPLPENVFRDERAARKSYDTARVVLIQDNFRANLTGPDLGWNFCPPQKEIFDRSLPIGAQFLPLRDLQMDFTGPREGLG